MAPLEKLLVALQSRICDTCRFGNQVLTINKRSCMVCHIFGENVLLSSSTRCVASDCGSTYAAAAHFTCHFWNIMTLFNFSNACLMRETPPLGEVIMSVFVYIHHKHSIGNSETSHSEPEIDANICDKGRELKRCTGKNPPTTVV